MSENKYCPECGNKMEKSNRYCDLCGYDTMEDKEMSLTNRATISPQPSPSRKPTSTPIREGAHPNWSNMENFVSVLGSLAWIIGLINAIISLIGGISNLVIGALSYSSYSILTSISAIVNGIIVLILTINFVKPRFSEPCSKKDWDFLYNDVFIIGDVKFPWMLIWGILMEIFGYGWGGAPILICSLILLFAGPRVYDWKVH